MANLEKFSCSLLKMAMDWFHSNHTIFLLCNILKCALHWFQFYLQPHCIRGNFIRKRWLTFQIQDMEEENHSQLIISSENLLIIIDPDLERWYFNSYSRGYHVYMNIWIPLIGDESLTSQKEKENEYIKTQKFRRKNFGRNIFGRFMKIVLGDSLCDPSTFKTFDDNFLVVSEVVIQTQKPTSMNGL